MDDVNTEESSPLLDEENNEDKHKKEGLLSCRHVLSILAFLGFVNVYCLRVNLSVAIVVMVNSSYNVAENGTIDDSCNTTSPNSTVHHDKDGHFPWDNNLQGIILGSFFYGYITTQLLGGRLAEIFGGKLLFGLGVLCTSVLTIVTPPAAELSVYVLIAVRILEGVGEGVTFPAMHAMLSKWAPVYERSKLGTFIYAGAQFGTVLSLPLSGLVSDKLGWEWVFYIFGSLGCLWFVVWMLLVHDTPAKHPRISPAERIYIEKAIGHQHEEKTPIPWGQMIKSLPLWATLVAHVCYNWGFYTMLTNTPKYMKDVLHYDISSNGLLSAIPYVAMWLVMTLGGQLADYLRSKEIFSTTTVRKIFNTLGMVIPALGLAATGYLGCDRILAITTLTIAGGAGGLVMSGYGVNHLDLAPPFAGTLLGITNGAATIPGFVGPQVVGILTNKNSTREQWKKVFFISSGIYMFGAIFFLLFGSGKEQIWAKPGYAALQKEKQNQRERHAQVEDEVLNFSRTAPPAMTDSATFRYRQDLDASG